MANSFRSLRMAATLALLPLTGLAGCQGVGAEQIQAYAVITEGIVRAQLAVDIGSMTDERLLKTQRAVQIAKPITASVANLTNEYLNDIDAEVARRGLAP